MTENQYKYFYSVFLCGPGPNDSRTDAGLRPDIVQQELTEVNHIISKKWLSAKQKKYSNCLSRLFSLDSHRVLSSTGMPLQCPLGNVVHALPSASSSEEQLCSDTKTSKIQGSLSSQKNKCNYSNTSLWLFNSAISFLGSCKNAGFLGVYTHLI